MRARRLTEGEKALTEEAFGGLLRPDTVRLWPAPWPIRRAFVPGRWFGREWIVWPKTTLPADFAMAPLRLQAVLVHELVHVWQAQSGVNLLTAKFRAGDRPTAYVYPLGDDCLWAGLNIEQQAMIIEHRFTLSRGGRVPADHAFYDRICPWARKMEI